MALLRNLRLSGRVRYTAKRWDPAHWRWRVEIRWAGRVAWNWTPTEALADKQLQLADAMRGHGGERF